MFDVSKGFNLLKNYHFVTGDREYQEFSYVFTTGTNYQIQICCDENLRLEIFDKDRRKVATNELQSKLMHTIQYKVQATGIYYMRFYKSPTSATEAEVYLAFTRK